MFQSCFFVRISELFWAANLIALTRSRFNIDVIILMCLRIIINNSRCVSFLNVFLIMRIPIAVGRRSNFHPSNSLSNFSVGGSLIFMNIFSFDLLLHIIYQLEVAYVSATLRSPTLYAAKKEFPKTKIGITKCITKSASFCRRHENSEYELLNMFMYNRWRHSLDGFCSRYACSSYIDGKVGLCGLSTE